MRKHDDPQRRGAERGRDEWSTEPCGWAGKEKARTRGELARRRNMTIAWVVGAACSGIGWYSVNVWAGFGLPWWGWLIFAAIIAGGFNRQLELARLKRSADLALEQRAEADRWGEG